MNSPDYIRDKIYSKKTVVKDDDANKVTKKMNFQDEDLKTPEHDEMVLWLLNKENLISAIPSVQNFFNNNKIWCRVIFSDASCNKERDFIMDSIKKIPDFWYKIEGDTLLDTDIEDIYKTNINSYGYYGKYHVSRYSDWDRKYKIWGGWNRERDATLEEHQKDDVAYESACVDAKSQYIELVKSIWQELRNEYLECQDKVATSKKDMKNIKILSEIPITGYNKYIIGYCDIKIEYKFRPLTTDNFCHWYGKSDEMNSTFNPEYIEAKPKIYSFGDTLRQLRTYENYIQKYKIYLFTKDLRFKDAFESQEIQVIDANIMNQKC